jgi:stage IV sporulation protein FA
MARSTPDEIRKRIANRNKGKGSSVSKKPERQLMWPGDDEKYGFPPVYSSSDKEEDGHPLFKKEVFIFKILASALLFLIVAILFRDHTARFDSARNLVTKAMDTDFKFATVAKWYEDKFGKPLALLPFADEEGAKTEVQKEYAVPASGKILENFEKNGKGIMIETNKGAEVKAVKEGKVTFAGVKDGLGKTVIIQHADQSESWYGNLSDVKVRLFDYVDKQAVVGTVSDSTGEDKSKGKYYLAIKKGQSFIDPIQVIRFE